MPQQLTGMQVMKKLNPLLQDEIYAFLKQIPKGLDTQLNKLWLESLSEAYSVDRLETDEWLYIQSELPAPFEPMVMTFTIGEAVVGYFDGDNYYNMQHMKLPEPAKFKYIQLQ
jgi:hypothetical protein